MEIARHFRYLRIDYITVIISDQQYGRISRYSDYLCLQPVTCSNSLTFGV